MEKLLYLGSRIARNASNSQILLYWIIRCLSISSINKPLRCGGFLAIQQAIFYRTDSPNTPMQNTDDGQSYIMGLLHILSRVRHVPRRSAAIFLLYFQLDLTSVQPKSQDDIFRAVTPQVINELGNSGTATEATVFRNWNDFRESTGLRICQTKEGIVGSFPPKVARSHIMATISDV